MVLHKVVTYLCSYPTVFIKENRPTKPPNCPELLGAAYLLKQKQWDHLLIFWGHMLDPGKPVAELMQHPSVLEPTMVTDGKALYDSYQKEILGNNLTDNRAGLETRVMEG